MERVIGIGLILICVSLASAQVSSDEAIAKLKARQAAKEADRAKLVAITKGELDDLRSEIDSLKKEVQSLKAVQAAAVPADNSDIVSLETGGPKKVVTTPSKVRFVLEVKVGVTRQQLFTYVAQRKDSYRITKDVRGADKQELITMENFIIQKVFDGTSTNGVDTFRNYADKKVPEKTWDLVLVNDVITDMSATANRSEPR